MDKVYKCIGASNHTGHDRADNDYYATEPKAVELLLQREKFSDLIWEPAVGGGHIAQVLCDHGYKVVGSDIVDRGYPGTNVLDFLNPTLEQTDLYKAMVEHFDGDIITNPPYSLLNEFIERAMGILKPGHRLAMFVRIQAIEGQARRKIYEEYPIDCIYVPSARLKCMMNGEDKGAGSAVCYGWFIWTKGKNEETRLRWLD